LASSITAPPSPVTPVLVANADGQNVDSVGSVKTEQKDVVVVEKPPPVSL
jgi:hypothetical protein